MSSTYRRLYPPTIPSLRRYSCFGCWRQPIALYTLFFPPKSHLPINRPTGTSTARLGALCRHLIEAVMSTLVPSSMLESPVGYLHLVLSAASSLISMKLFRVISELEDRFFSALLDASIVLAVLYMIRRGCAWMVRKFRVPRTSSNLDILKVIVSYSCTTTQLPDNPFIHLRCLDKPSLQAILPTISTRMRTAWNPIVASSSSWMASSYRLMPL